MAFLFSAVWILLVVLLPSQSIGAPSRLQALPNGPINAGYVGEGCNATQIVQAVENGLNVLFWFALNIVDGGKGAPVFEGGPPRSCVASVVAELAVRQLNTTHMISVGGWDAPHPTTRFTAEAVFQSFEAWNQQQIVPYDGVDWDLEVSRQRCMKFPCHKSRLVTLDSL